MKPQRHILLAMAWESPNVQRGVLIYAKEHHWLMEIPTPHDVDLVRHWQGDGIICTLVPNRQLPDDPPLAGQTGADGRNGLGHPLVASGTGALEDKPSAVNAAWRPSIFSTKAFPGISLRRPEPDRLE